MNLQPHSEHVCECCGIRAANRSDYCVSCESAMINEIMAELCDVGASLSGEDVDAFAIEQTASVAPIAPEAA